MAGNKQSGQVISCFPGKSDGAKKNGNFIFRATAIARNHFVLPQQELVPVILSATDCNKLSHTKGLLPGAGAATWGIISSFVQTHASFMSELLLLLCLLTIPLSVFQAPNIQQIV